MYYNSFIIRYYFKVNDFEICKLEIISPPIANNENHKILYAFRYLLISTWQEVKVNN